MLIRGLQKQSVIDYPGKICSVIFLANCNFRCHYCHNPELVFNKTEQLESFAEQEILDFLEERKELIEAVCITGGEPTLEKELPEFIEKIKQLGFSVKLDTNGTNPEMLRQLIKKELIDYIAMDIKAPFDKYDKVVGLNAHTGNIKESIKLIRDFGNYEFRITVLPELISENDLLSIAETLKGSRAFCLQQFRAKNCLNPEFNSKKTYSLEELEHFREILKPFFENIEIRAE